MYNEPFWWMITEDEYDWYELSNHKSHAGSYYEIRQMAVIKLPLNPPCGSAVVGSFWICILCHIHPQGQDCPEAASPASKECHLIVWKLQMHHLLILNLKFNTGVPPAWQTPVIGIQRSNPTCWSWSHDQLEFPTPVPELYLAQHLNG